MRPLCLIVNPSAGGGRAAKLLPRAEAALRARGLVFRVERTTSMEHARELARGALEAGESAVAMGGDGLTGAVAGELRGTGAALGILPGGRGNDFARKLGIPFEPEAACDVLAAGRERAVDVAETGTGRAYLGIASAGFDSDVQVIANRTRLPLGGAVYAYSTLAALRGWRDADWHVEIDGAAHDFTGYSVAVANSGIFGGGMQLVPHASLEDGELDVLFTRTARRTGYLRNLPRVFKGAHVGEPNLTFLRGREISFHADRPFAAYADGDPIADLPVTIRVRPHALQVLAP
ncbi:MAG TPA: diacylglycerol kinase family protein [Solirubrobacteraceae bacterium]|nr:diacylglycerol kinase family protein [Solirubrobacteraceae bacterium]